MTSFFPTINNTGSSGDKIVPNNSPFWGPRIFGVERKEHLKYLDIGQLLVLFFQRGLLKVSIFMSIKSNNFQVHGLWENYDEQFENEEDFTMPQLFEKPAKIGKILVSKHFLIVHVSGKKVLGLSSDQNMASYNKSDRSHRSDKQGCFTISSQGIFKVNFS